MDTQTIDQEFETLQTEFQDVAKTVQGLAAKMQAAEKAGDTNATEWLADLEHVAQDIDDEQTQVKALLLAIHGFIGEVTPTQQAPAAAPAGENPPLFAPGKKPDEDDAQEQPQPHHRGMLGGLLAGGMMGGGGMFGGYYGGGFGQAMEMGMAMNLGANLVNSIFR